MKHGSGYRIDKCRRKYKLLLLAKTDITLAKSFALTYKKIKFGSKEEQQLAYGAFNLAVVISYAKPFKKSNLGRISSKYEKFNQANYAKLHEELIKLRDKCFAHTDDEISKIKIGLLKDNRINKYVGVFSGEMKYLSLKEDDFYLVAELCDDLIKRLDQEIEGMKNYILEYA